MRAAPAALHFLAPQTALAKSGLAGIYVFYTTLERENGMGRYKGTVV